MTSRPWREAATLLLAVGGGQPRHSAAFDYQVLLLQRSARSSFMPCAQVFPGGVAEPADFSPAWRELLPKGPRCGLGAEPPARPPLFAAGRPELGEASLPADVAFRICAIRETFEESGLLLLEPAAQEGASRADAPARLLPLAAGLEEWRRRVQGDPGSFLELCRHLGCAPHLRALHEWGNWLTPVGRAGPGGRRYDTAFYLCCCLGQEPPAASHDRQEVADCRVRVPGWQLARLASGALGGWRGLLQAEPGLGREGSSSLGSDQLLASRNLVCIVGWPDMGKGVLNYSVFRILAR